MRVPPQISAAASQRAAIGVSKGERQVNDPHRRMLDFPPPGYLAAGMAAGP
jgi:hypothetical protein